MEWALILVIFSGTSFDAGVAMNNIKFNSKSLCENAKMITPSLVSRTGIHQAVCIRIK